MIQRQLRDFKDFAEVTDAFNEMIEELHATAEHLSEEIQLQLTGDKAITTKQHASNNI